MRKIGEAQLRGIIRSNLESISKKLGGNRSSEKELNNFLTTRKSFSTKEMIKEIGLVISPGYEVSDFLEDLAYKEEVSFDPHTDTYTVIGKV